MWKKLDKASKKGEKWYEKAQKCVVMFRDSGKITLNKCEKGGICKMKPAAIFKKICTICTKIVQLAHIGYFVNEMVYLYKLYI